MKIRVPVFKAACVAASLLLLSGCTVYQSIGKSVGSFLHPVSGHDFVHIDTSAWSQDNALVYFYRPHSQWAADEIEAPSVYIDDSHYFNIRADSFTWLEVSPGQRHIAMRRPLLGLEGLNSFSLSLIADATLTLEPGRIYYLRYSEIEPPERSHPDLDPEHPLANGDLQLVTREYAMQADQIVATRFLNSDLLAPNHAAVSIVEVNQDTDYENQKAALEEARVLEIEQMKAEGRYKEAAWYWPFGGGPLEPLEADQQLEALERDYAQLELERERAREAESGGGWWIF